MAKTGAQMKANLDAAHNKAIAQQRANTPVPGMDMAKDKKAGIKQGSKKDKALDKRRGIKDK